MLMWLLEDVLALEIALFGFITFRTILAALTAMVVSLAFGPWFIRYLTAHKLGQPIREVGPRSHFDKAGT
ncbi:MAG: phospho-N-acetylmuramoyl-pentapeptide-transferase, partial [Wenzhouxiangellaceae bacterium]